MRRFSYAVWLVSASSKNDLIIFSFSCAFNEKINAKFNRIKNADRFILKGEKLVFKTLKNRTNIVTPFNESDLIFEQKRTKFEFKS